jgi:hypothetical protein
MNTNIKEFCTAAENASEIMYIESHCWSLGFMVAFVNSLEK